MHFVFYRTTDVFLAEEILKDQGVMPDIVPTPVQDKAYCGVCLEVEETYVETATLILNDKIIDYQQVM